MGRAPRISRIALGLALLLATGCSSRHSVQAHLDGPYPKKLSEWHLFTASTPKLTPNAGVVPYDLNTPLFSDYASKYRFVWMPAGTTAQYREDGPFEFPVGTILVKTFAFPREAKSAAASEERLIETRLLVHAKNGWVGLPYVWDASQQDATLQLVPDPVPVHFTDATGRAHDFTYVIPNANECHECHDNQKVMLPIGLKARNLNKDFAYAEGTENQLGHLARIGYLQGLPGSGPIPKAALWDDAGSPVADRARAYLDNNCAHCHQPGGQAGYTGVDFRWTQTDIVHQGLCKSPNSAGFVGALRYDLVPGDPAHSILIYRLESTAPKISMPALGRDVVHSEGVQLLRDWIASLRGNCGEGGEWRVAATTRDKAAISPHASHFHLAGEFCRAWVGVRLEALSHLFTTVMRALRGARAGWSVWRKKPNRRARQGFAKGARLGTWEIRPRRSERAGPVLASVCWS